MKKLMLLLLTVTATMQSSEKTETASSVNITILSTLEKNKKMISVTVPNTATVQHIAATLSAMTGIPEKNICLMMPSSVRPLARSVGLKNDKLIKQIPNIDKSCLHARCLLQSNL